MNAFELRFYEAGILDANEARCNVLACRSEWYAALSKELGVQIADKRGDSIGAYIKGVQYELDRIFLLK